MLANDMILCEEKRGTTWEEQSNSMLYSGEGFICRCGYQRKA